MRIANQTIIEHKLTPHQEHRPTTLQLIKIQSNVQKHKHEDILWEMTAYVSGLLVFLGNWEP